VVARGAEEEKHLEELLQRGKTNGGTSRANPHR